MIYIAIGGLGFLIIHLFDIVSLKRVPVAKPATWLVGGGLLIYSLIMVSLAPNKLSLPTWSTGIGWCLLLISISLLAYSLFVNLPFRETYLATGVGDKLVVTGLYALVRHPGVHWFIITMLALVLVTRSQLMLIAGPVFILLDVILVVIQDRFFFRRMFQGYDRYRRETPMLFPNRKSINTFKKGLWPARTK
jgi:protein-S-isoprenylcysteine O-methyltransferase Ste14